MDPLKERCTPHTKLRANSITNEPTHSQKSLKDEIQKRLTDFTEQTPALQEGMGTVTKIIAWTDQSPQALSAPESTQNFSQMGLGPGHNARATRMWGSTKSKKRPKKSLPGANSKPKRAKSARDCHWPASPVGGKRYDALVKNQLANTVYGHGYRVYTKLLQGKRHREPTIWLC